jgi:NAD-dependent deacetylase
VSAGTERLAELLRESGRTVALTGAGISVPSGIPDFRSPGTGLWENVDPMEVAHLDVFLNDPGRFWSYYRPRFGMLSDKEPNPAHRVLARLEEQGMLDGLITQNIDTLHRKAGSRNVVEVHGTIETASCWTCKTSYPLGEIEPLFDPDGIARCACGGPVKPDVVLFGEMLPEAAMLEAHALCERADLLLCVGTSLEVYPVAGLPSVTRAAGGAVAIVTKGPTPYDAEAEVRLDGDVVDELEALLRLL